MFNYIRNKFYLFLLISALAVAALFLCTCGSWDEGGVEGESDSGIVNIAIKMPNQKSLKDPAPSGVTSITLRIYTDDYFSYDESVDIPIDTGSTQVDVPSDTELYLYLEIIRSEICYSDEQGPITVKPGEVKDVEFNDIEEGCRIIYVDVSNTSGIEDGTPARPYNTIQEGINDASPGYTVSVAEGAYYIIAPIEMKGGIVLQGAGYSTTTIKRLTSLGLDIIHADSVTNSTINGFTIDGGISDTGICCTNSSLGISNNKITNNIRGIYCYDSSPTISGNIITGNYGKGIYLDGTSNPDIGGGGSSSGGNIIIGNGSTAGDYDLYNTTLNAIYAKNNTWDNSSPCGVDIYTTGGPVIWDDVQPECEGSTSIIYVDVGNTSGTEDGTYLNPYNTIQEGIDAASSGYIVSVAEGTYTTINNSINMISEITLQGAGSSMSIISEIGESSAIDVSNITNSTISGFAISGYYGISCSNSSLTISNNAIENSLYGIYCSDSSPTISGNTITSNSSQGVYLTGTSNPDLGGGANSSTGGNTITGNGSTAGDYDLYNETVNTIYAQNNTWDNSSPCGVDIYTSPTAGGAVVWDIIENACN